MLAKERVLTMFGKEVKMKLIEKGIKQRTLANQIGISESFLSQILYGIRPSKYYIHKIAHVLDIDISKYIA